MELVAQACDEDFGACARRQLWDHALVLLQGAKSKGLEPGPAMHSAACGSCRAVWPVVLRLHLGSGSVHVG